MFKVFYLRLLNSVAPPPKKTFLGRKILGRAFDPPTRTAKVTPTFCEVETEFLCITYINFSLQRVKGKTPHRVSTARIIMPFTGNSVNTYMCAETLFSRSCSKCRPTRLDKHTVLQFQSHILSILENISGD